MGAAEAVILQRAVVKRQNVLVGGGTSTGKTMLVNAILAEIAESNDRVVLIEVSLPSCGCGPSGRRSHGSHVECWLRFPPVVLVLVPAALASGLAPRSEHPKVRNSIISTTSRRPTSSLPNHYSGLPKQGVPHLGPQLPGDFGRPMLAASKEPDAKEQRMAQAAEAVRTSKPFIATEKQSGGFAAEMVAPVVEPGPALPAAFVAPASTGRQPAGPQARVPECCR